MIKPCYQGEQCEQILHVLLRNWLRTLQTKANRCSNKQFTPTEKTYKSFSLSCWLKKGGNDSPVSIMFREVTEPKCRHCFHHVLRPFPQETSLFSCCVLSRRIGYKSEGNHHSIFCCQGFIIVHLSIHLSTKDFPPTSKQPVCAI